MERTAIMVDGAFFIKRAMKIFGPLDPDELSLRLFRYCCYHLKLPRSNGGQQSEGCQNGGGHEKLDYLYRIFFYDCPPLTKKIHHPLTGQLIDFSRSPQSMWRLQFHEEMKKRRKVALRLGRLDDSNLSWTITNEKTKKLCRKVLTVDDLGETDLMLNVKQKGVDMRIGLDIASLAYKKQVTKIVLISGDSDFVPAAKLARREGIDFVLDPMWATITPDLHEHIDGLRSTFPKPPTIRPAQTSPALQSAVTVQPTQPTGTNPGTNT